MSKEILKVGDWIQYIAINGQSQHGKVDSLVEDMNEKETRVDLKLLNGKKDSIWMNDDWIKTHPNASSLLDEKYNERNKQSNDLQQRKRRNVKLIDSETVEFENGKQMKVIVNNGKQPTSVYWIDDTTIGFNNGSRVRIPENYATEYSHDTVNHPSHYNYGEIEVINFIEQVTKHYNPNVAYHIGNAIKYLARSLHKNGKEDIEKAKWYIERAFENWDVE